MQPEKQEIATQPERQPINGWMKLFTSTGVQVTLPVPVDGTTFDYGGAFAAVGSALTAGFLVQMPGLEAGEEKERIGWVLRGAFEKEGEVTPYILLYSANEQLTWAVLKVYLNKPEDVSAFEYASGMKLDSLPDYIGDNKPQRGAAHKTDAFIIKAPQPFGVVFKKNPKHDDTEVGKMKPARLFVRWEKTRPAANSNGHAADPAAKVTAKEVQTLSDMIRELDEMWKPRRFNISKFLAFLGSQSFAELTATQYETAVNEIRNMMNEETQKQSQGANA